MKKGYVQIYTGNGKGKTTAALGLTMRAAGHGFRVNIIQFLKGGTSGELRTIEKLDTVSVFRVTDETKYIWKLTPEQKADMQNRSKEMLKRAQQWFELENIDILILDEIMAAISLDIVKLEDVLMILDKRPDSVEIIMTGRDVPDELQERAHLITEMKDIKHYFNDGVAARKGIEF